MKQLIFSSILSLLMIGCGSSETPSKPKPVAPKGSDIEVTWELKQNGYEGKGLALTSLTLKNNGQGKLENNWSLYFHQPRPFAEKQVTDQFVFENINGDYFKISPTDSFPGIEAGASYEIQYVNSAWFLKAVDAPSGIFIVFRDSTGKELGAERVAKVSISPFPGGKKLAIDGGTDLVLPTHESIYAANEANVVFSADSLCPITPTPFHYDKLEGKLAIKSGVTVSGTEGLKSELNLLVQQFSADFGIELSEVGEAGLISLSVDSNLKVNGNREEAYTLEVGPEGVQIVGASAKGVFYGVQSLKALMPIAAYEKKAVELSYVKVEDAPRFEYRGLHLDVARNFQKKEAVKKVIDMMSFYKLNKFHFHIIDDEGWRLAIDGLPELTEVGSKRAYSPDESTAINPAYGSGPFADEKSAGTGFYTKADFVEILKYAKERHIEVIPELDFPGHARAAIVSMKARQKRLLAEGKEKEANQYILHDPNDTSKYRSIQFYNDNVVCVCQESTYSFLEKVLSEVVNMYKDAGLELKNVHMGGDEVPHPTKNDPDNSVWAGSPLCQAYMAAHPEYKKPEELFYYFVERFSDIMAKQGVATGGWEEIGLKKIEGEDGEVAVAANEKFLGKNFTTYVWNTVWTWGTEDRGYLLANAGYQVVLSNVNNLYFDLAYDKDPNDPGYYWGGFVDTRKAWSFIPLNFYAESIRDRWMNVLPDSTANGKTRLTVEGSKNVKGIQGQLWSETVKSSDMMEYYLFPKMLGLVERAWAVDPKWDRLEGDDKARKIQEDWNVFSSKVGQFELQRLMYVHGGLNNRIAPAGAIIKDEQLHANTAYPGFEIRFTTDDSEPTVSSTLYEGPVGVKPGVQVKLKVFDAKGRSSKTTILK